ncbi:ribose transport system substrate-binding protein [Variovorax boronicumulans]|uniref:Ribose transport system substrate-binding protein n=1 Tax=Variovorax boronicumulans TaxID=436515 RepID=A0AAW8D6L1_9BURK|nr:ABC transporter substrate-binding protein [Variovorax boronicumulans]MDP9896835.1 ribose transport system substrate-binding protein [Variovorax boronicumulans]MDP9993922.1 ribose transport system substrate-binding protein [Variovorax boronicumulans]MDQ0005215.1 ribose transport system substrate-binding protein [Variovorax boronicumulans]MDQ0038967.1 ribose transport system substrate-binding protein [Variovorax boronicumulans]MDQ0044749.1 ribose transport system substrate-binding protein [Va
MLKTVLAALSASLLVLAVPVSAQTKPLRVGISSPESNNPFHVALARSIAATLKERGIEPLLLSANADVAAQVNNIGDLVAAKVDAILVAPLDEEGAVQAVQRAKAAGIPVFMYARALDQKYSDLWLSFVGMDAVAVGTAKGQWLVANASPGKVAMLTGPAGAAPMLEQERGFRKVIESKGFKVVFAQPSQQTRERGIKLAEDALVAHRDLVAIYASNDDLALGAAQAVKSAGLKGKVLTMGLNGSPTALAAVHSGDMAATVLLDPVAWGKTAANTVADYLQNKQTPPRFIPMQHRTVGQSEAFDLIPPALREKLGVKQ